MQNLAFTPIVFGAAVGLAFAAGACSSESSSTSPAADGGSPNDAVADAGTPPAYPSSPYGLTVGETIPDLGFDGWMGSGGYDTARSAAVHLSTYYDPTGATGTKLLVINVCSVWCVTCQFAYDSFKEKAADYRTKGAEVVSVLYENGDAKPVALGEASAFATEKGVSIPIFVDPAYQMSAAVRPAEVPSYVIVSVRDMKVLGTVLNANDGPPWDFVDQKLSEIK